MTRAWEEKVIAGLSCGDVLAVLSDYLDDDLAAPARRQVEAHLRGCEGCARFGGEFQGTVRALRQHLRDPGSQPGGALPGGVLERLRTALDRER